MLTATQQNETANRPRQIRQCCRICQEHCWGDCDGLEISESQYLKTEDIAAGLGPPTEEEEPYCFHLAENRDGDFDPVTGDLISDLNHKPILQG